MKRCRTLLMSWVSLIAVVGCAGTGELIPLQIHPIRDEVRIGFEVRILPSGGGGVDSRTAGAIRPVLESGHTSGAVSAISMSREATPLI